MTDAAVSFSMVNLNPLFRIFHVSLHFFCRGKKKLQIGDLFFQFSERVSFIPGILVKMACKCKCNFNTMPLTRWEWIAFLQNKVIHLPIPTLFLLSLSNTLFPWPQGNHNPNSIPRSSKNPKTKQLLVNCNGCLFKWALKPSLVDNNHCSRPDAVAAWNGAGEIYLCDLVDCYFWDCSVDDLLFVWWSMMIDSYKSICVLDWRSSSFCSCFFPHRFYFACINLYS